MSVAPLRPCPHPHCGRLCRGGRCSKHPRASASARGYDSRWAKYAALWLLRLPWCGQRQDGTFSREHSWCVRRRLRKPAEVVDHIQPLSLGGELLDPANHQSLCASCNVRKGAG